MEHEWFRRAATTDESSRKIAALAATGGEDDAAVEPPTPAKRLADVADAAVAVHKRQTQQKQMLQQHRQPASPLSKSRDDSPRPALSASRRKSFKDNMDSLVERLAYELAAAAAAATTTDITTNTTTDEDDDEDDDDGGCGRRRNVTAKKSTNPCRTTLSRANGTRTMPVGGCKDAAAMAPFAFRRVYVVDEPPPPVSAAPASPDYHRRPRAPSTSSTPNSSTDNSSASDCSSDTVSEFSIDSSSDRSSIISLEDSLDAWCRPSGHAHHHLHHRLGATRQLSASCFNVWDAGNGGRRKWPKECTGAVARAMSQFANGDSRPAGRLKVFDTRNELKDKRCVGLELMRERNGNVVVIREIKANGGSRYARCSEVKCESVRSRIRKLQVHNGVQMDKSADIF